MIALILLWVGAVLFLNGLWLLGRVSDQEIGVINLFVGGVTLLAALASALRGGASLDDIGFGALVLLFSFTYIWIGINRFLQTDGRGLGWYSLFVAITALPISIELLRGATTTWDYWLGLNWLAWAVLWFLYWALLVPKRVGVQLVGVLTLAVGIATAWLPAYLLLRGYMAL
ncbi:AmiS/UreI family transporter [Sphaerobacter sp.]|uniref:AmiS/UreI family transporter n=1 Tax=Sphaerobacter sp. TaxID=2099654 RepID=UPI001E18F7CA|nr:AmiS/UreI family transporter [Sphaerobacter sp.]MBX5444094.1 AmiS/UreI family transporter [Sphaerobacter sp.]